MYGKASNSARTQPVCPMALGPARLDLRFEGIRRSELLGCGSALQQQRSDNRTRATKSPWEAVRKSWRARRSPRLPSQSRTPAFSRTPKRRCPDSAAILRARHGRSLGIGPRGAKLVDGKGSHRTEASQSNAPPHPGSVFIYRAEVILLQLGIILDDLVFSLAGGQPAENVPDGYPQAPNAGLAGALSGLDGNARAVQGSHNPILPRPLNESCALLDLPGGAAVPSG